MRLLKLSSSLLLLLVACNTPSEHAQYMSYGKDQRTNLCFVLYDRSVSWVPCTPEVEKAIQADANKLR